MYMTISLGCSEISSVNLDAPRCMAHRPEEIKFNVVKCAGRVDRVEYYWATLRLQRRFNPADQGSAVDGDVCTCDVRRSRACEE